MDGTSDLGTRPGQSFTAVSEAYIGTPVVSSDGHLLGTVTSAASQEDGTTVLLVDLDQAVGANADNFEVMLAAGQVSDGQVELIWPKIDILAALDLQNTTGTNN